MSARKIGRRSLARGRIGRSLSDVAAARNIEEDFPDDIGEPDDFPDNIDEPPDDIALGMLFLVTHALYLRAKARLEETLPAGTIIGDKEIGELMGSWQADAVLSEKEKGIRFQPSSALMDAIDESEDRELGERCSCAVCVERRRKG